MCCSINDKPHSQKMFLFAHMHMQKYALLSTYNIMKTLDLLLSSTDDEQRRSHKHCAYFEFELQAESGHHCSGWNRNKSIYLLFTIHTKRYRKQGCIFQTGRDNFHSSFISRARKFHPTHCTVSVFHCKEIYQERLELILASSFSCL